MPGDAAAIDLGVLQQQLQTHRSSLADQIMQHLPDQTSTSSHAPQPTQSARRPATLGVGASTSQSNSYSAADHKFRAKLGAKAGRKRSLEDIKPAAPPEDDDEGDSRGSAAQKRARPQRRMDMFAAAEAKIKAGKEKAQVHDVPPHVATMSKAQRKKWNKQQRLAASEKSNSPSSEEPPAMTPLQSSMLASLQGARFRSINERLYTHPSRDALAFMQDDPQLFDDYHAGFRQQVRKWPKNPVDKIAELLTPSKKAKSTHRIRAASIPGALVVDMGAGEGGLAKMLAAHGFHTLSYDLVNTPDGWVRGLDAAALHALPLPGVYMPLGIVWDRDANSITAASTVDVVVFCLSLMGTNWVDMICEAWRVLKPNGEMVIAEVTSRLGSTGDTHAFTELLCALGFHVDWVDTTNTHFVLLTCTKTVEARQADTSQPGPTLCPTASPSELRRAVTNAAQANDARSTLVQVVLTQASARQTFVSSFHEPAPSLKDIQYVRHRTAGTHIVSRAASSSVERSLSSSRTAPSSSKASNSNSTSGTYSSSSQTNFSATSESISPTMDRSDSTQSRGDNDQRTSTRGNGNVSSRGSESDRSISTGGNNQPRQTSRSNDTSDSGNDRRPTSTTEGNNRPTQTSARRTSNDNNDSSSTSDNDDQRTSSSTSSRSSSTSSEASRTSQSSSTNGVSDGRSSTSSNDQSRTSGSSLSSGSSTSPTRSSSQGPTSSSTNSNSSSNDSSSSNNSTNSSNRSTVSSSNSAGPTSSQDGAITSSSSGLNTATSTDVFVTTIDGHAVTSTRKSVFTSTPDAGDRSANKNNGDDGYWHDGGAVGGTFAAVGIVVVALIIGLGWLLYRRRKSKRMDADVMAAASAAAATTRTPFDDDDDDDIMGGPFGTPGGGNGSVDQNSGLHGSVGPPSLEANGAQAAQPLYQPSSGYHQPAHYVNSVDDPYGSMHGSGVPVSTGAALGGLGQPAVQYYSPGRAGSNDAQRGVYESLPTDSAFVYQRPSVDSSGYHAVGSSAYAYAQPDPFRDSTEADPAAAASNLQYHPSVSGQSNASGQPSSSAEYEPAQSHVSHMYMPHVPEDAPYPVSYNNATAPATGAAAPVSGEVTAWPSFIPGVAPTHNENYAREAEPSTTHYADMSGHNAGVVQAFGGDNEGQSAMDHGDWDPPALSSAWFPTSVNDQKQASPPSEPAMHSEMPSSSLPPYPSNENSAPWPTDEKAAATRPPVSTPPATGHQPLMVRNPSPEDE